MNVGKSDTFQRNGQQQELWGYALHRFLQQKGFVRGEGQEEEHRGGFSQLSGEPKDIQRE